MKAAQRAGLLCEIASSNVKMMTWWAISSFRQHHWPWLQHVKVKVQRHSQFGPNASNEKCTMDRVLFKIKYHYNSRKYVTLTFDIWTWHLTFDIDLWPWPLTLRMIHYYIDALKEKLQNKKNVWRHVTQNSTLYVSTKTTHPISISSNNILQPTRSVWLPVPKLCLKRWFSWFWCVWPWPSDFKVIWEFTICYCARLV